MNAKNAQFIKECKSMIASAKTDEALQTLMNSVSKSQNELLLISSKWVELKKHWISGILAPADFERERLSINRSLLLFL